VATASAVVSIDVKQYSAKPIAQPVLSTSELLFRAAENAGLQPAWVNPGGLFAINVGGVEKYVNYGRSHLNSHIAVSLAGNKLMTRTILGRHGLPNIPFARKWTLDGAKAFLSKHKVIIAKPLCGAGAKDINIIDNPKDFVRLTIKNYILEKYLEGKEMRYLVLDGSVIGVHHSKYGTSVEETRFLERISYSRNDWDETLVDLAVRVTAILGLKFAAVDFIVTPDGGKYILEVNSAPGLKWFHAPTKGPVVNIAEQLVATII
jgi:glutathione synthase/RimK-type ligase-like ATP-grasp enzyme